MQIYCKMGAIKSQNFGVIKYTTFFVFFGILPFLPLAILQMHEFNPCAIARIRNKVKSTSHVVRHENSPEKKCNKIYECLVAIKLEILHDFLVQNCYTRHSNHENDIQ